MVSGLMCLRVLERRRVDFLGGFDFAMSEEVGCGRTHLLMLFLLFAAIVGSMYPGSEDDFLIVFFSGDLNLWSFSFLGGE